MPVTPATTNKRNGAGARPTEIVFGLENSTGMATWRLSTWVFVIEEQLDKDKGILQAEHSSSMDVKCLSTTKNSGDLLLLKDSGNLDVYREERDMFVNW
ncbi:hypothetical protein BOTCAL_0166g00100 [Botryotinia calthae]|uniref:Uncharacterized protein n=1 Tax=Botryotinia calthae TaxID=38488 RepID=A0A4Y8D419_9HELO|nr:hypothetical protein BOTCAL_0166g00100 [Botryotinia calthae]